MWYLYVHTIILHGLLSYDTSPIMGVDVSLHTVTLLMIIRNSQWTMSSLYSLKFFLPSIFVIGEPLFFFVGCHYSPFTPSQVYDANASSHPYGLFQHKTYKTNCVQNSNHTSATPEHKLNGHSLTSHPCEVLLSLTQ